jgi:N-acetylneuraminate synthase
LGARVVEKHFTDDNNRVGPDHKFAMDPTTWKHMITESRYLEMALGNDQKNIEENELDTAVLQRRCVRLSQNVRKGQTITKDNLAFLRPAPKKALAPYEYVDLIGKIMKFDKATGDILLAEDVD